MQTTTENQFGKKATPPPPSFEQKLYRTLRNMDRAMVSEYMESFGLEEDRAAIGAKLKDCADQMTEEAFCEGIENGDLPAAQLSAVEMNVLFRGIDAACGSSGPASGGAA